MPFVLLVVFVVYLLLFFFINFGCLSENFSIFYQQGRFLQKHFHLNMASK